MTYFIFTSIDYNEMRIGGRKIILFILSISHLIIVKIFESSFKKRNINVNNLLGYRTPNSMKSTKNWNIAQISFIKHCKKLGIIFTVIGIFWSPIDLVFQKNVISLILQCLVCLLLFLLIIFFTEKDIKNLEK